MFLIFGPFHHKNIIYIDYVKFSFNQQKHKQNKTACADCTFTNIKSKSKKNRQYPSIFLLKNYLKTFLVFRPHFYTFNESYLYLKCDFWICFHIRNFDQHCDEKKIQTTFFSLLCLHSNKHLAKLVRSISFPQWWDKTSVYNKLVMILYI